MDKLNAMIYEFLDRGYQLQFEHSYGKPVKLWIYSNRMSPELGGCVPLPHFIGETMEECLDKAWKKYIQHYE